MERSPAFAAKHKMTMQKGQPMKLMKLSARMQEPSDSSNKEEADGEKYDYNCLRQKHSEALTYTERMWKQKYSDSNS